MFSNEKEFEEKEIWESWLNEEDSECLIQIRMKVKELYNENRNYRDLPYFTPHGTEHCQAV